VVSSLNQNCESQLQFRWGDGSLGDREKSVLIDYFISLARNIRFYTFPDPRIFCATRAISNCKCSQMPSLFCVALGPSQPPIQWVLGALSLGVKWPGREADHSSPSSAEVKIAWSYTSTPPVRLHGVVLS
jgi:hypothetical protein